MHLGTRPTAIPILSLAFPTQSVSLLCPTLRSFPNTILTRYQPTGHLVLITLIYGTVPATWNISTTVRLTPHSRKTPQLGLIGLLKYHDKTSLMSLWGEKTFVFFSCLRSSKSAERRLTCGLMKRLLSYRPCSWFLSPLSGLIRRLRRRRPRPPYNWESYIGLWFISLTQKLVRGVFLRSGALGLVCCCQKCRKIGCLSRRKTCLKVWNDLHWQHFSLTGVL